MDPLLASGIFAFGLLFGSFLNVCIYRLPRGLSVVWPGSACPKCSTPIKTETPNKLNDGDEGEPASGGEYRLF